MPTPAQSLGQHGETLAAQHLETLGYTIVARNWRCASGEIDLVAHDGKEWVFVEVKTRRSSNTDTAIESVTSGKLERLTTTAQAYLEMHDLLEKTSWRIDLVVIALSRQGTQIEVIRDAVGW